MLWKTICSGCVHAPVYDNNGNKVEKKCPFCRTLTPGSNAAIIDPLKKRMEVGDAQAIYELGCCYAEGRYGLPQDRAKAFELWHRAGELGCTGAFNNIGHAYFFGRGVERDDKKAIYYYELSAIGGSVKSRYSLGIFEKRAENYEKALKHFLNAVGSGDHDSLKTIKQMYKDGEATKDDYAKALQAYQSYLSEIKSDDRDKAAEYSDDYKYYE